MNQSPMEKPHTRSGLATLASLLILCAGVIHLLIVPLHWKHSPQHGGFFIFAGVVEIAIGAALWWRPGATQYRFGFVTASTLLVLWLVTRVLPAPFEHVPGEVEVLGVCCKLAEGVALVALGSAIISAAETPAGRAAAWRHVGALAVTGFLIGAVIYGVGMMVDVALGTPAEFYGHHHEENPPFSAPPSEHQHHSTSSALGVA